MDIRELEETAQLAHLNVGGEALAAALPAFEQMLGFFAAMDGADADTAAFGAAGAGETAGAARFRRDAADAAADAAAGAGIADAMLERAGERDGRFIVIPNVL